MKTILLQPNFMKRSMLVFHCVTSIIGRTSLQSLHGRKYVFSCYFSKLQASDICSRPHLCLTIQHFSTIIKPENICWRGSSHAVLQEKLVIALKDHQLDEAWEAYSDFNILYGFPNQHLMSRLITELSYSSDPNFLRKACDLVVLFQKEKPNLLRPDLLANLSLCFARAQMPVPASKILRLMLEKEWLLSVDILGLVILHLVKTEIGMYLASNILVEICDHFQQLCLEKSASGKLKKPDKMIFNLILDACVTFGSSFKALLIIDLMAREGVLGDAQTIVIISRIHEMHGQLDELKKFKVYVHPVSVSLICHYWQFYDSLLSLHFKFNDIDGAAGLILDIYKCWGSSQEDKREPPKPCLVPVGSRNLRRGLKLQILPQLLPKESVHKVKGKEELLLYKNGRIFLSNKALAKLIIRYKRCGRIGELSQLLNSIQKKLDSSKGDTLCSDVIEACIHLGWLETAHDILEDLELAGSPLDVSSYMSLLTAYYKGKMFREAKVLLKQMCKAGIIKDAPGETVTSACISMVEYESNLHPKPVHSIDKSNLAKSIVQETKEEDKAVPSVVHEFNSSIFFFMKAGMVGEALNTYRKMQAKKIEPTALTFFILLYGYSSLGMYREITFLWGDIKRTRENGNLVANRDFYEFLVLNFLRGGYFQRVMEVITYMKEHDMYLDKWLYKSEFLRVHKDLYRSLRASNARNEVQSKRLDHVRAFRKWVGIN